MGRLEGNDRRDDVSEEAERKCLLCWARVKKRVKGEGSGGRHGRRHNSPAGHTSFASQPPNYARTRPFFFFSFFIFFSVEGEEGGREEGRQTREGLHAGFTNPVLHPRVA